MLNALAANQDGNDVSIVLPRPEGFEDAIGEVVPMVMGIMMGGPGGPGGPGFGEAEIEVEGDPFGVVPIHSVLHQKRRQLTTYSNNPGQTTD